MQTVWAPDSKIFLGNRNDFRTVKAEHLKFDNSYDIGCPTKGNHRNSKYKTKKRHLSSPHKTFSMVNSKNPLHHSTLLSPINTQLTHRHFIQKSLQTTPRFSSKNPSLLNN